MPNVKVDLARLVAILDADDLIGICLHCGAEHEPVDPDARGDVCDECKRPAVYGVEELLIGADLRR